MKYEIAWLRSHLKCPKTLQQPVMHCSVNARAIGINSLDSFELKSEECLV